jgi:basic amino acid/polyamine antiporter, APA family
MSLEAKVTPGVAQEVATEGLFLRKSSGLVRELGFRGAFGLNMGAVSVIIGLAFFVFMLELFPGANVTVALLGGGLLTGLLAFVYSQLASTMPRAGGDYLYSSRIFNPAVGAWVGGGLLVLLLWTIASVTLLFVDTFLTFSFATLGSALHIAALTTFATTIAGHTGTFITGLVILLALFSVSAASTELVGRISWITVLLGVLAVLVIIGELVFHSHGAFVSAFGKQSSGANSYAAVISGASAHGWRPGFQASATLNALPWAFSVFGSFWFAIYVGGEIKRPAQTLRLANFATIGIALVLSIAAWVTMQAVAGTHFLQASAALQAAAPAAYAKISSIATTPMAYAVMLSGDPITKVIMAIGLMAAIIPGTLAFIAATSRVLFAMSFDRLLPESVAQVKGRHRVPLVALGVSAAIVLVFYYLVVYSAGFSTAFRNTIVIAAMIVLVASLASVALPFLRKDLYDASPKVVGGRWLGLEPIVWLGGASALFDGVLVYLTLTKGAYSGGYVTSSIILLIVTALLGPTLYLVARVLRRQKGIDVSLAMRELPPD